MVQTKNLWSSLLRDLFIGVTIFAGVITYGFLNPDIDMDVLMSIWDSTSIYFVVCILYFFVIEFTYTNNNHQSSKYAA